MNSRALVTMVSRGLSFAARMRLLPVVSLLFTLFAVPKNGYCRVRSGLKLRYKMYPLSEESSYVSSSPMYRESSYSTLLAPPIKQEYYWSRRRFLNGLRLPCWQHYVPCTIDHLYSKSGKVQRMWYMVRGDFTDLRYELL